MSIVVVRLVGGLGNQLFQYAAARAVALRSRSGLVFDLSWFSSVTDRKYALAPFAIDAQILVDSKTAPKSMARNYWQRIERRLVSGLGLRKYGCPVFMERHFHFDLTVLNLRAPVYLDGYFQSERYFADCVAAVTSELSMPPPSSTRTQILLEEIQTSEAICLHIRRGDYVSNPAANAFHGTCSMDYYAAGFAVAAEEMRNPKCFVFSDDPGWVRSNFALDAPTTIVDIHGPCEPHEDLRLMAACQNFVIANSSLSWWGAWLGKYPDKRVIAPQTWFSGSANDISDLLPSGWVRL